MVGRRGKQIFRRERRDRGSTRRWLIAAVLIAAIWGAGSMAGQGPSSPLVLPEPMIVVTRDSKTILSVKAATATRRSLASALRRQLPPRAVERRGRGEIRVQYLRDRTAERALTLQPLGGRLEVSRRTISARVAAPAVKQQQRNTCESAALHILLAAYGKQVSQSALQAALPISGTPDPLDRPDGQPVWGDPDLGYVGRPNGGGVAGGFGVYPGPIMRVAERYGVRLEDLTGRNAAAIYSRLRQGRAVMAWIGLSDGPYARWTSPQGKAIRVNFGEHTIVLHGIDVRGALEVSNPLEGTRERWSPAQFQTLWKRLGNRALATP